MGLQNTFQKLAQSILDRAGDLVIPVTLVRVTLGTYDVDSDTNVASTESVVTRGFLSGLNEHELDWFNAEWHIQKLTIAYLDLMLTVKGKDYFMIEGERWEVQRVKRLPRSTATIFYIRRP